MAALLLLRWDSTHKFAGFNIQRSCDLQNRLESGVNEPALRLGDVVLVEASDLGQFVLRQAAFDAERSESTTKLDGRFCLPFVPPFLVHSASTR